MSDERVRLTAWVSGRVQGVGFRWWTRSQAERLGLVGSASNLPDGRVEVVAEGPRTACERLAELLESSGTPGQVAHVTARYSRPEGGFAAFRDR
jgi:acylphosphatase